MFTAVVSAYSYILRALKILLSFHRESCYIPRVRVEAVYAPYKAGVTAVRAFIYGVIDYPSPVDLIPPFFFFHAPTEPGYCYDLPLKY